MSNEVATVTIYDAAKYIFKYLDRSLSQIELYKLLWFCQGFHYGNTGIPLFKEPFEAWEHGPVPRILWTHFRGKTRLTIDDFADFGRARKIKGRSKKIVDLVLDHYGQYSPSALRQLSHQCRPWIDHKDDVDQTIPNSEIYDYFKQLIK